MFLSVKKYNPCIYKAKKLRFLIALFFLLAYGKSMGQDFQWVFVPEGAEGYNQIMSDVTSLVTDSQGNVYATGRFGGQWDFNDTEGEKLIGSLKATVSCFVLKLDKNKNFLWVKYLSTGDVTPDDEYSLVAGYTISLDKFENPIITCSIDVWGSPPVILEPIDKTILEDYMSINYALVMKFDREGNDLYSKTFPTLSIMGTDVDDNNNLIITGFTETNDAEVNVIYTTHVIKLNASDLSTIWDKQIDGYSVFPNKVVCDSHNNIVLSADFKQQLNFGGTAFTSTPNNINTNFICKLGPDGQELWCKKTGTNNMSFLTDEQDNIYFDQQYSAFSPPPAFNDAALAIPAAGPAGNLIVKTDPQGNLIQLIPIFGDNPNRIGSLNRNSLGEIIVIISYVEGTAYVKTTDFPIYNSDRVGTLVVKLNSQGDLINYKSIPVANVLNGVGTRSRSRVIGSPACIDYEDNILIGKNFKGGQDFDPDPGYIHRANASGASSAYILKLSRCDMRPPNAKASQVFCSYQNPTIASLDPDEFNVNWYASADSAVPLVKTMALVNGQKYYAAKKKVENCDEITQRLEVLVIVNPEPPAPVVNAVQPCFNENLTLGDLNVLGQDLSFYITNTTQNLPLSITTPVRPDFTYYVSQAINGCVSVRVPVRISSQSAMNPNDYTVYQCDNDKDGLETVNLSDYNEFIVNNYAAGNYVVTYHKSYQDALDNIGPILGYQNYQAGNETIHARVFSNLYSCYDFAELSIVLLNPPEIAKLDVKDLASDSNSITILPFDENHLYSLDGIHYQDNNFFDNLDGGEYNVYVKDKRDVCSEVTDKVYLLNYPKFFTPNGDGINDYWKIKFSVFQFLFNVEIYDRYGKLITVFDKTAIGWDGKLNGANLPATDYWFKITRISEQETIYRGHFSLVR